MPGTQDMVGSRADVPAEGTRLYQGMALIYAKPLAGRGGEGPAEHRK